MYSSSLILATTLAVAPLVAAAPSAQFFPFPPFCRLYTDNFDNLPSSSVPETSPIGQYDGVTYDKFAVRTNNGATGSTYGVVPHSNSQDAGAGVLSDLIQDGSVQIYPAGRILSAPSRVFDLYSFYFGCGIASAVPNTPGVSTACTVSITGVDINGNNVPQYTASFTPRSSTAEPMVLVQLPSSYRLLRSVQIGVAQSVPQRTILLIDDVVHCNYS